MKPKVYVETSIISYLTSDRSRDVIILGRQEITIDWWEDGPQSYDLYVSDVVEQEARLGNALMSKRRLGVIKDLPKLATVENAATLAEILVKRKAVPENASADALHIAVATVERMNFC